jgi:hypothetical protein
VRSSALTYGKRWREAGHEVGTFLLGLMPVLGLNIATSALSALPSRVGAIAGLAVVAIVFLFLTTSLVHFIRECPTGGQKVGFSLGFLGVLLAYALMGIAYLSYLSDNVRRVNFEIQRQIAPNDWAPAPLQFDDERERLLRESGKFQMPDRSLDLDLDLTKPDPSAARSIESLDVTAPTDAPVPEGPPLSLPMPPPNASPLSLPRGLRPPPE